MPTNKLWIEHTERAAWQSVQALREKLAEAERRAERMAPPVGGWRELFDALDAARESHSLSGETYADLIRGALDRLARAEAERRSLEARLAGEPAPAFQPARGSSRGDAPSGWNARDDADSERPNRSERRFFRDIRKRSRGFGKGPSRAELELALSNIETRLADLPELDPTEIMEIAADLGALALRLFPRRDPDDDE